MRYRAFAYGTLMLPDIAATVIGERPEPEAAHLRDHARRALRQRVYPGAVQRPGDAIEGVVYHGLTSAALNRIDHFESEIYRRHRVTVLAGNEARPCSALVYLVRPRWHPLLLPHDWCPQTFRRHWHARYFELCTPQCLQQTPGRTRAALSRR